MEQPYNLSFNKNSEEEQKVKSRKEDSATFIKQTNREQEEGTQEEKNKESRKEDVVILTDEVTRLIEVFQAKTKIFNAHCFRMAPLDKKETISNLKLFQNSMNELLSEFESKLKSMEQHILALEAKKNVEAKEAIIQRSQMATTYGEIASSNSLRKEFPPAAQPVSGQNIIQSKKNKVTKNSFNTKEIINQLARMDYDPSQFKDLDESQLRELFTTLTGIPLNKPNREAQITNNPLIISEIKVAGTSQTSKTHVSDELEEKELSFKEFLAETSKPNGSSTDYVSAKELDDELEIKEECDSRGENDLDGRSKPNAGP